MLRIKKKEWVHLNGEMEDNILVNGRMESNMERESSLIKKGKNWRQNGLMEKELKPKQEIWQKMINDKQDISIILGKKEKIIFSILDEVEFSSFDLHFMCFKVR